MTRIPLAHLLLALFQVVAVACRPSAAWGQELVVNGRSEQPQLSTGSWNCYSSVPGWTAVSGMYSCFEVQNRAVGTAEDGNHHIEFDSYAPSGCHGQFCGLRRTAPHFRLPCPSGIVFGLDQTHRCDLNPVSVRVHQGVWMPLVHPEALTVAVDCQVITKPTSN